MTTIEEYLNNVTPGQRLALERVRNIVKQTLPEAEETISYGMPTLKYKGKSLIHFAAFKNHMSIFGHIQAVEEKLENFKLSHKGTVQFTEDNPVPEHVIKEIVSNRFAEITDDKANSKK